MPIPEAARDGSAFAVDVADDVLAIDGDRPERASELIGLAQVLKSYDAMLVHSGRPGHLHLFARIGDTDLLDRYKERARALGLDVRRTIRPPLAPHRLGLPVGLLAPDDPAEALAALTPPARRPRRRISSRMEALLRTGDYQAQGYHPRSEAIQALALAFGSS